ncbi:MAG: hypothetical protein BWX80_03985 [Candidatus Hydrogenedentes bacterium ADurb.Bin101]|nr:MAG: hypothetical protein BWX80_03985 [Candidatus Hydrogenedentes bacterium ADurb.Bin101]
MVVVLVFPVRAHQRRGADQHAERRIGLLYRSFEPRFLFRTPDGFVRAVPHRVRTAEVPPLHQPNLQVFAPAKRAIRLLTHRRLLAEKGQALFPRQRAIALSRPTVIHQSIMVILHEITGHIPVEGALERHGIKAVPFEAGQFRGRPPGQRLVIIFNVARMYEEIRVQFQHGVINLVAPVRVVPARVIPAGHHDKVHFRGLFRQRSGAEAAFHATGHLTVRHRFPFNQSDIAGTGVQTGQRKLTGIIPGFVHRLPIALYFGFRSLFRPIRHPHQARRTRRRPFHVLKGAPARNIRYGQVAAGPLLARHLRKGRTIRIALRRPRQARPHKDTVRRHLAHLDAIGHVNGIGGSRGTRHKNHGHHKISVSRHDCSFPAHRFKAFTSTRCKTPSDSVRQVLINANDGILWQEPYWISVRPGLTSPP